MSVHLPVECEGATSRVISHPAKRTLSYTATTAVEPLNAKADSGVAPSLARAFFTCIGTAVAVAVGLAADDAVRKTPKNVISLVAFVLRVPDIPPSCLTTASLPKCKLWSAWYMQLDSFVNLSAEGKSTRRSYLTARASYVIRRDKYCQAGLAAALK